MAWTVEEALEILANYWVFIQYNTVKKDGNLVIGNIEVRPA